jgi:RNA polymerase sigma-70 factor (ECF subfamily)
MVAIMADLAMVERAQRGDRDAFAHLLDDHYALIYRVAYRFMGQAQDAEDIAQDVCIALASKLASYRGDSQFSTWLYRIVVNACKDALKKKSTHRNLEHSYTEYAQHDAASTQDTQRGVQWLYQTIATLDEPLPETALLVLSEELSHAQAGQVLGCAESTVSWRMSEVRKLLKKAWETSHD